MGVGLALVIFGGALLELRAGEAPDIASAGSAPAHTESISDPSGTSRESDAKAGAPGDGLNVSDGASDVASGSSTETGA